ncbi:hypothetical protein VFPPC_16682 [Pochonia chlamydosporia 170]|uniref:Uncharacterized protein n=1 Tax=Pochonia chlamydosporia 170 TaxID=1380566 RepID=A0A179F722_METCM|nr:hypothetical protein VFPPC_16682 [Pochonia chlamydosporia 170]OAQ60953.1 hypothetical protein VFPPC_16682 [Pochonia chlamydosporia 170]
MNRVLSATSWCFALSAFAVLPPGYCSRLAIRKESTPDNLSPQTHSAVPVGDLEFRMFCPDKPDGLSSIGLSLFPALSALFCGLTRILKSKRSIFNSGR